MTGAGYRALLRAPDVPRLAGAGLLLGTAGTMTPVAFVLFARSVTHSIATASLVLAASTAGGLISGPALGRLVDRIGPRRAVLRLALPDVLTDAAFIITARAGAGAAALIPIAGLAGAISAPAATALRSVWSETLPDGAARQAGYAVLPVLQETTFIAGPLIAGAAIALGSPTAAVVIIACFSLIGALVFATARRAADPGTPAPRRRGLPALAGAGIRTVVATSGAFGLTFGVLDVAFPAYARAHGSAGTAGVLLSAFAAGSWIGALLYGLRQRSTSAGERYPWLCLLAAAGLAPLIATPGLAAMVALSALAGLCFAPITTCQMAAIDEVAPAGHRAEAFAWLGTLYGTGLAIGAAAAGQLIAASSTRVALAAACGATLLAAAASAARARTLRPAPKPQAAE